MEVEKSTVLKEIDMHNGIVLNVKRVKKQQVPPETPALSQSEILTQALSADNVDGECDKTSTQQGDASKTANLPPPPPPPLDLDILLPKSGALVINCWACDRTSKSSQNYRKVTEKKERE